MTARLGLLVAVGACGTGEGASYIVLDQPARAALVEVEAGGRSHGGALPLEVELGTPVELVTATGRRPLAMEPGMVYEVQGGVARVRAWRLRGDVRTDAVELEGPEPVVRNLASALGAAPEPWNGRWRLSGPDALLRLSWMGDVADVAAVSLVLTDAARERARAEWTARPATVEVVPAAGDATPGDPSLVGLYTSGAGELRDHLFLDAEGNYWVGRGCDVFHVGRYRRSDGRVVLDGTNLALTIGKDGRLEAPGQVFTTAEDP